MPNVEYSALRRLVFQFVYHPARMKAKAEVPTTNATWGRAFGPCWNVVAKGDVTPWLEWRTGCLQTRPDRNKGKDGRGFERLITVLRRFIMLLYLSFLKPPPFLVDPATYHPYILITPQISNDLRTEFPNIQLDLYYLWIPSGFRPTHPAGLKKLTTYGNASRYKEIRVPFPPNIKDKQDWSLALISGQNSGDLRIPLDKLDSFSRPLPLLSMPILFRSKSEHNPTKQERIRRIYTFPSSSSPEPVSFSLVEHTSFDLDKVRTLLCPMISHKHDSRRKSGTAVLVLAPGS